MIGVLLIIMGITLMSLGITALVLLFLRMRRQNGE